MRAAYACAARSAALRRLLDSIGSFGAWAVLWAILAATEKKVTLGYIFAIFFGWCIGWLSATIARAVYPPPKKVYLTGDPRQP